MKKITKKLLATVFLMFSLFLFSQPTTGPTHSKMVVGYYAQWAIYARDYNVWDIDASKLTHLMYAFFGTEYNALHPEDTKLYSLDPYADFQHNEGNHHYSEPYMGNFADLRDLKLANPHLKIIISVGGWTKSQFLPAIAENPIARDALAADMANMIVKYPWIDGFDIDWEFPLYGGTDGNEKLNGNVIPAQPHTTNDHKNLVYLLKAMKLAMPTKSISIAAGNNVAKASEQFIGPANRPAGMTEDLTTYCDFITCFGYDFGGNWNDKTCYNAPLHGSGNVNDPLHSADPKLVQSLENLVNIYLNDVGIPSNMFVMGLPFYGKIFENVGTQNPVPGFPGLFNTAPREPAIVKGCGLPQPPKGTWDAIDCESSGSVEFCDLAGDLGGSTIPTAGRHLLDPDNPSQLKASSIAAGWVKYWDDTAKVPYLYNATLHQFLMYDDEQSIDEKVKFILSKNLGGGMIWELSQDSRSTDPLPNRLLTQVNNSFSAMPSDITAIFKDASNAFIPGVAVTLTKLSDSSTLTATSDANGSVSFPNLQSFVGYTISYTKSGYVFLPTTTNISSLDADTTYNVVGSNQIVSISGAVKTPAPTATLIPNVVVKLINIASSEVLATQTSVDGNFSFTNLISGLNYKVIAEKLYYTFTEASLTNVTTNQTGVLVEGTMATYTISGTVKDGVTPIVGATVTASFSATSLTSVTNSSGEYSFTNLTPGITYTLTTTNTGQTFSPASAVISNLGANQTQNFLLNNYLISGVVKNGAVPVSGAVVALTLDPWKYLLVSTDSNGKYYFNNSDLVGSTTFSLKMNQWEQPGGEPKPIYYPLLGYPTSSIPTVPAIFNFNSQPQSVNLSFTNPLNSSSVTIGATGSINLSTTSDMLIADGSTITSVVYTINGVNYTATNTTGSNYNYSWSPPANLFNTDVTVSALATASNAMTATASITFHLNCTGVGCPNVAPTVVWNLPTSTTVNQASGFAAINIEVSAADSDGSVSGVVINVNGANHAMTAGSANKYTYSFTPTAYQDYPIIITATDNLGLQAVLNKTIKVINSIFIPLPEKVIVGYAHSWENAGAPFMYFNQMVGKKYNVVMYSFIETVSSDGFTPQLTINSPRYYTGGVFDPQLLKDDIATLRNQGIPVIVSIGGANGHVSLETIQQKNTFIAGVKSIVDQYQFDGLDLDFEAGSMNFGAGALTDFSYAGISAYPKLKNVVDAVKELKTFYGSGFHITAAPETFYVQVGYSTYSNTAGSFLPIINNIRDELDLLMVQLYNTGSINALDATAYATPTPDFLVSMSDMLIKGFNVASTGYHFNGLPASKIVVAMPACPAAGGGYIAPTNAIKALDYLRFGTTFAGRNYTLQAGGPHPDLRGVMTWSINWDASTTCNSTSYEFANAYHNYFFLPLGNKDFTASEIILYSNNDGTININSGTMIMQRVRVFDLRGVLIAKKDGINSFETTIITRKTNQVLLVEITDNNGNKIIKKIVQ